YVTPRTTIVAALSAAVMILLVVELVERRLVGQPQPLDTPDVVAADDAIRAASARTCAAAAIGLLLVLLSGQFELLSHVDWLRDRPYGLNVASLFAYAGAFFLWIA